MTQASHTQPSWLEMIPAEFDKTGITSKQRKLIAEAPGTLFPRLLPAAERKAAAAPAGQIDGQDSLFGDLS
jgi:hypothetical protein